MFDYKRALASVLATHPDDELEPLFTPWGEQLDPEHVLEEYPRPNLQRDSYINLNGWWEYAFTMTNDGLYSVPETLDSIPECFEGTILVPFSPESLLSGVQQQLHPEETLWYKRNVSLNVSAGKRVLLHFEGVDFACSCFVNGTLVGLHHGAYAPFCFDITNALHIESDQSSSICECEIILAVKDPSEYGCQPRGKQRIERGTIWCSAQSGIWQSVWIEEVDPVYGESLRIEADPDTERLYVELSVKNEYEYDVDVHGVIKIYPQISGEEGSRFRTDVVAQSGSAYRVNALSTQAFEFVVTVKRPHLWHPDDPYLYDIQIELSYDEEERSGSDSLMSYCAFRTISTEFIFDLSKTQGITSDKKVICLNHEPIFLKGVLDQGYWPDGLLTAPSEEALRYDIELAKCLGFNLMRKHIKTENSRWYYLCDKLGMLVWQDMVNGGAREYSTFYTSQLPTVFPWIANHLDDTHKQERFGIDSDLAKAFWIDSSVEVVEHLRNYPCIIGWTVFNEAWGQFDANAMTQLLSLLDDTRLFDQASGWCDQAGGDCISDHNYFRDIEVPKARFLEDRRAPVISEFGGYAYRVPDHSCVSRAYGYAVMETEDDFKSEVRRIIDEADALHPQGLAGYVYTQLTDVEEEVNGLVTYDRRIIKVELKTT